MENGNEYENAGGILVGRNAVLEALKAGRQIDGIYLRHLSGDTTVTGSLRVILSMAKEQQVQIKQVSEKKLQEMSDGVTHQGVVAVCAAITYLDLTELLQKIQEKGTPPLLVVCDAIQDPHNLGAILRTADAAGADGVIISKRNSASVTQTVYKTSAGAASVIPICRVGNLHQTIKQLKQHNIFLYCADMAGEVYYDVSYAKGAALLVGSEGFGVSALLKKESDVLVRIPMLGQINSLNASVATGIVLYEMAKNRV